jgi:hypothetical protein
LDTSTARYRAARATKGIRFGIARRTQAEFPGVHGKHEPIVTRSPAASFRASAAFEGSFHRGLVDPGLDFGAACKLVQILPSGKKSLLDNLPRCGFAADQLNRQSVRLGFASGEGFFECAQVHLIA